MPVRILRKTYNDSNGLAWTLVFLYACPGGSNPNSGKRQTLPMTAPNIVQNLVNRDVSNWQIDALVYELYGLTEEEIRIVEEKGS